MNDSISLPLRSGLGLCIVVWLWACSPQPPDSPDPAQDHSAGPAAAVTGETSAELDGIVRELPDACELLSPERAGALLGGAVKGDTASSSAFRSVCTYKTRAPDDGRALTLVISSLRPDVLDYRGLSGNEFVAAVSSAVAPSYQDVELIDTADDPGNGSFLFDLEDAIALWVNSGILHRVPMQQSPNELFTLVRLSGFDEQRASELVRNIGADVQDGLAGGR